MRTEKIGKTKIIIADEGKCFKGENIDNIITTLYLGKFDSKDNYEEVNIDDFQYELDMLQHQEDNMSQMDTEAAILEETLEPDINVNEEI